MARQELLTIMRTFHRAMENADVATLRQLVDPKFYLVHITGFHQPRDAWFSVIANKRYSYHSIKVNEDQVDITESRDGNTATAHGRGVFDATIEGSHAPWRLQFTMHFAKQNEGDWIIKHSDYDSY